MIDQKGSSVLRIVDLVFELFMLFACPLGGRSQM